jgi:hypothetical protein
VLLAKALSLYPDDPALRTLRFLTIPPTWEDSDWVHRNLSTKPDFLDALLVYVERSGNRDEAAGLLSDYRDRGGVSPRASVLAMEFGIDSKAAETAFIGSNGLSDMNLTRRAYAALPDNLKEAIPEALKNQTIKSVSDTDGDGYPEETYLIDHGALKELAEDEDQDGIPEVVVTFDASGPKGYRLVEGRERFDFAYGVYPALSGLTRYYENDVSFVYYVVPGTAVFPVFGSSGPAPGGGPWYLAAAPDLMLLGDAGIRRFRENVYKIEERLGTVVFRRILLENGKPIFHEESIDRDGIMNRRVYYENELPVRGERDLDKDGRFETFEIYKNGRLAAINFDEKRSGKPEFIEAFIDPVKRSWDLNSDGLIDAEEYHLGKGKVQRVFALALDGMFTAGRMDTRKYWDALELNRKR